MRKGQTGNLGLLDTFFYLVSGIKKCTLVSVLILVKNTKPACLVVVRAVPKAFQQLECRAHFVSPDFVKHFYSAKEELLVSETR